MAQVTVKSLAETVNASVEQLLEKFSEVGLHQTSGSDAVSHEEKIQLLEYLHKGSKRDRPQVRKKIVSGLKVADKGSAPNVVVEVRKTRHYAKDAPPPQEPTPEEAIEAQAKDEVKPKAESESSAKPQTPSTKDQPIDKDTKAEPQAASEPTPTANQETEEKAKSKSVEKPLPQAKTKSTSAKGKVGKDEETKQASTRSNAKLTEKPAEKIKRGKKDKQDSPSEAAKKKEKDARQKLHVQSDKRGKRKFTKKKFLAKNIVQEQKHEFELPTEPVARDVIVYDNIPAKELAQGMAIKGGELIKKIMQLGMQVTINQTLDQDTAILIVEEFGHKAKILKQADTVENELKELIQEGTDIRPRAPVVTILGHVDHGKTSLLDYICKSEVAEGEAGSITQHVGAYQIEHEGSKITFLDTPGHAAFTAMRARGARITDIIILVVAADDGVMPQTEESIEHAKLSDVPVIVAVNKVDKEDIDIEKIKGDLGKYEIVPEEWGGKNIFVEVSAKTGQGIDQLLEAILLQTEVMELKVAFDGTAQGVVVESALDRGRGVMATILVQTGVLKKGDMILAGSECGKIRNMLGEKGQDLPFVEPSYPAVVFGLPNVPQVGEKVFVIKDERKAKKIAEYRERLEREKSSMKSIISSENFLEQLPGDQIVIKILLKADVHGSVEAVKQALEDISGENAKCEIIATGVGGINESDVNLALTSKAMIVGFNVRADTRANKLIQANRDLLVRYYSIIYEASDDVKKMVLGMLTPEIRETIIGVAEVKDIFRSSKFGTVAGSQVAEGVVRRGNPIRVLRDNVVVYEGELESLRRFKDEVKEVSNGTECGIAVKNYNDVKINDQIEVYERVEVQRSI
ncbi:MAG: translation initiation factor IF-2 [Candidatus Oxydemutatoraceae bacterium WSBS_2016_MAG_OTU14]